MKVHTMVNLKGNLTFLGKYSSHYLRTAVHFLFLFLFLLLEFHSNTCASNLQI